jgi:ATP-dependent helicase HrpA
VTYKFEPAAEDDGITLTVPLLLLPQLDPGELDWTIPGWHAEKVTALLWELPRALRRELGEIPALGRAVAAKLTPFHGPMLPELARVTSELTGIVVREDAFRPSAIASYLRLTLRLVDQHGKVVAEGRDIDALLSRHGALARAVWKSAAPPPTWEKKGLTAWEGFELPPFIARTVLGTEVRSYPALVDRGTSVDLCLLESSAAAESASRAGVRRLLVLAAKGAISSITPKLPAALPRPDAALVSRAEHEAFRAMVLARIVDAAFGLAKDVPLPRDKAEFERVLGAGLPRIPKAFALFSELIAAIAKELDRTLGALRSAATHPSGRLAQKDIEAQVTRLFPPDLFSWIPVANLEHYPRYLRAAQARLARAITDPRKDLDKLAPFTPLFAAFLAREQGAREQDAARELRFLFEELRVAIFAPELKTAVPVSLARLKAAVQELR